MIIYPAIDLYKGQAVRLARGDYEDITVYSDNPVAVAESFKAAGSTAVHIVDLEGARDGVPANFDIIQRIALEVELDVQVGGGIRTLEIIEKYLNIGVRRVILGTAAVSSPGFLEEMVRRFGDAIAVSADIKDGFVAINGWTELSDFQLDDCCQTVENLGVKTLICTDISKDGLLSGTNMDLYRTLRENMSTYLIASGGITTLDEVRTLAQLKVDGAIIGKSLYAGNIKLEEAIAAAASF